MSTDPVSLMSHSVAHDGPKLVDPSEDVEIVSKDAAGHVETQHASVLVTNPRASHDELWSCVSQLFNEARQCYEYKLRESGRVLALGYKYHTAKGQPNIHLCLTRHDERQVVSGTPVERARQRVYKRFLIPLTPFMRETKEGLLELTLRTRAGSDDVLGEIASLAQQNHGTDAQVVVRKVKPTSVEIRALAVQAAEEQARQEAHRRALAEVAALEDERRKVPVYPDLPDRVIRGSANMPEMYINANEDMFTDPLSSDDAGADGGDVLERQKNEILSRYAVSSSAKATDGRDLEGSATYVRDRVHEQLDNLRALVANHFCACILSDHKDAEALNHYHSLTGNRRAPVPVVFSLSDVRHAFEYDFDRVKRDGVVCLCSPTCLLKPGDELWCHNWEAGDWFRIADPKHFSLAAHLSRPDAGSAFQIHKVMLNCSEMQPTTVSGIESVLERFAAAQKASAASFRSQSLATLATGKLPAAVPVAPSAPSASFAGVKSKRGAAPASTSPARVAPSSASVQTRATKVTSRAVSGTGAKKACSTCPSQSIRSMRRVAQQPAVDVQSQTEDDDDDEEDDDSIADDDEEQQRVFG